MKRKTRKRSCYVLCQPRLSIIVVKVRNMRNHCLFLCTPIRYVQFFLPCISLPDPRAQVTRFFIPQNSIGSVCSFAQFIYKSRHLTVVSKRVSVRLHIRVDKYHRYRLGKLVLPSLVIKTNFFGGGRRDEIPQMTFKRGRALLVIDMIGSTLTRM